MIKFNVQSMTNRVCWRGPAAPSNVTWWTVAEFHEKHLSLSWCPADDVRLANQGGLTAF